MEYRKATPEETKDMCMGKFLKGDHVREYGDRCVITDVLGFVDSEYNGEKKTKLHVMVQMKGKDFEFPLNKMNMNNIRMKVKNDDPDSWVGLQLLLNIKNAGKANEYVDASPILDEGFSEAGVKEEEVQ